MRVGLLTCGEVILVCVPFCSAQEHQQKGGESALTPPIMLSFEDGRLTAKFQSQPLRSLIEHLENVTRLDIVLAQGMDESQVSADLAGVALDDALRDLLSNYDTFFFYGGPKSEPATLQSVWVYPKGSASALKPVRPEEWASSSELELALRDSDPEVRALAYEALIGRPDRRSLVLDALSGARERDPYVRERLLSSALNKGFGIPSDVLQHLARADSSEQIRWIALDALADQPPAKQAAEAAMMDPSEIVRTRAKEVLVEFSRREERSLPEPETQADTPQR